jgi:co-chaperonin GroES (HSP10)
MSLPVTLMPNQLVVTGNKSVRGMLVDNRALLFGTILQSWTEVEQDMNVGDSVLFAREDVIEVEYESATYYVIDQSKIKFVETPEA